MKKKFRKEQDFLGDEIYSLENLINPKYINA